MRTAGGELAFLHEVDGARWLRPADAAALLTHARDADVLRGLGVAAPSQ
jgi:hypothetical protein